MGAGGALLVVCLMLCATLGLSGLTAGLTKQSAVCQLVLKGYGNKEGLKYGSLNCSTHDRSPLVVGVDRRYVGDNIQTQGVVLRDSWTECLPTVGITPRLDGSREIRVKSIAILSFCGAHHLEFESMLIEDLYRENYRQCGRGRTTATGHNVIDTYPCWVLRLSGVDGVISKGTFSGNAAGSIIGMTNTRLVALKSNFSINKAASGAAIVAWFANNVTLIDCEFTNNVAYGMEALMNPVPAAGESEFMVTGAHILEHPSVRIERQMDVAGNLGLGEGGAILVYNSSIRIIHSTFDTNIAEFGGALLLDYGASGAFINSVFVNNLAADGGAIYASLGDDIPLQFAVLLNSTHFNGNRAWTGSSLVLDGSYSSGSNRAMVSECAFDNSSGYLLYRNDYGSEYGPCDANDCDLASISAIMVDLQVVNSSIRDSWCSGVSILGGRCHITNSNISDSGLADRTKHVIAWNGLPSNCSALSVTGYSVIVIDGTSLITNSTGRYGAGVYISPTSSGASSALVKLLMPSRISGNIATVAGGGLFCEDPTCILEYDADHLQQIIYNNNAPVAPDVFVAPHTLSLLKGSIDAAGHAGNLTSDGAVPIKLQVVGASGVAVANTSYIATAASVELNRDTVAHFTNITTSNGVVMFLLRLPLGRYNVSVSLNPVIGSPYLPYAAGQPGALTKSFELILRSCNVGQIVSDVDGVCQSCPRGSYSVHANASVCNPCPVDSASCPGGALIVPRLGYWHSTRLATQLHECPNHDACQHSSSQNFSSISQACRDLVIQSQAAGGLAMAHAACQQLQTFTTHMSNSTYSDLLCSTGYSGNMCGVCQRDKGYTLVKPFLCKQCSQPGIIVSLFVVGWVLLLSMIKLLCYLTLQGAPAAISGATSSATFILKPFILYMQYMLIIGTLIVEWPLPISAGFLALSILFSSAAGETISIGCLLQSTPAWPVAIRRTLFYLSMPFVTLAALLLCECAWHACRRVRTRTQHITLTDHLLSSSMVVVFFFLPSLARTTLSLFACLEVDRFDAPDVAQDAMGTFWMFDMTQRCYHGYHQGWALGLGVPLAVLLCAGLPVTILCVVFSKHSDNSTHHFGFLYQMYRPKHRYWEAVVTLQTLVLIAISVFGYNVGVYAQVVMMNFALAAILIMLVAVKPYAQQASQLVMCYGITCTLVTSYLALTMWTDKFIPGFAPGDKYRIAAASLVLLMNLAYIVFVVRELLRRVDWKTMTSTAVAKVSGMWQRLSI